MTIMSDTAFAPSEAEWDHVEAQHSPGRDELLKVLDDAQGLLDKHDRRAPVSELTRIPSSSRVNSEIDPHLCTNVRWKGCYSEQLAGFYAAPRRCRRCVECSLWLSDKRLGRLFGGVSRWARAELTRVEAGERDTFRKQVKAAGDGLAYVSIPYADGSRAVLTEAEVDGEVVDLSPSALMARLKQLLVGASTGKRARIDGSRNWEKNEPEPDTGEAGAQKAERPHPVVWQDLGETKMPPAEREKEARRWGCVPDRSRSGRVVWSVAHLSALDRERLWWCLGFREAAS